MIKIRDNKIIDILYAICFSSFIFIQINNFLFIKSSIILESILFILYIMLIGYIYKIAK